MHPVTFIQAAPVIAHSSGVLTLVTMVEVDKEDKEDEESLTELKRLKVLLGEACKKVVECSKVKEAKGKGKQVCKPKPAKPVEVRSLSGVTQHKSSRG